MILAFSPQNISQIVISQKTECWHLDIRKTLLWKGQSDKVFGLKVNFASF